jgi:outer membrane immunogenic protein
VVLKNAILIAAAAASLLIAGVPAQAQAPKPMSWQGFYMGGSLGGAWEDPSVWTFADGRTAQPASASSWVGGLHTGYNWQFGHLVLGTETNYRFTNLNSSGACSVPVAGVFAVAPPPTPANCQQRIQNIFTFGGRAGWALNDWLLYGTGGYARAGLETTVSNAATGLPIDSTGYWHNGWFGGGGVEYALTPSIVVGVQYTHINVNDRIDSALPANPIENRNVGAKVDMVEARVSFKLWEGMWGPFTK